MYLNRFILDFYFEVDCPFCKRVKLNIIDKLKISDDIYVNEIDVEANTGSMEMDWFNDFAKKLNQESPTPVLRMHDKLGEGYDNWSYAFMLWKKKPTTITEQVLTEEEKLEKDIYDTIRKMKNTITIEVQPSWKLDEQYSLYNRRRGVFARVHKNQ